MMKVHQFVLNPEVSGATFISASDKMQNEFYKNYDSLKRRELLKSEDNIWIEILDWAENGPSKQMQEAYWASEACKVYMGMIKMESMKAFNST